MSLKGVRIYAETEEGVQHILTIMQCCDNPDTDLDLATPDGKVLMCMKDDSDLHYVLRHMKNNGAKDITDVD